MAEEGTGKVKSGRTFDGAYGFSFSIAVGLALLLVAGLVIPVFMMRDLFKSSEINAPCPSCSTPIKTSDATIQLTCPNCKRIIAVKDMKLHLVGK